MTTTERTAPRSPRPRRLQDDLLADLRQTAPIPIVRPEAVARAPVREQRRRPVDLATPTLEVRVTPLRWAGLSLRSRGTGTGLVLTVGPVRIALTVSRR